jgi:hypothetical protein
MGAGNATSIPFGLEFVLVFAALTFVALVACAVPIAFQIWRRTSRATLVSDEANGRVDVLLPERERPSLPGALMAGIDRYLRDHSRKETAMSETTSTRMNGQLAAFAIGAAVGAGLALLYAPYSGEETRQRLARTSRDIKDRVTGAVEATKDAIRDPRLRQSVTG